MTQLGNAIATFRRSYEELYGVPSVPVEPPFRPDFRAGLRVERVRMARLRLKLAKQDVSRGRLTVKAYAARVKDLTTDETPCHDCGEPIGDHRRFTGNGQVLCAECEREAFGH